MQILKLQHNVILYIQKSVSENARIAVLGVEKYKKNSEVEYPQPHPPPPTITYNTTPKFFVINNHLSSLYTQYSMGPFFRCPPPPPHGQILKKCPGITGCSCIVFNLFTKAEHLDLQYIVNLQRSLTPSFIFLKLCFILQFCFLFHLDITSSTTGNEKSPLKTIIPVWQVFYCVEGLGNIFKIVLNIFLISISFA